VLLSTLRAARSSVEPGEAEVAVGGEGAHAEIGGDRQRLAICPLGLIAFAARGVYVPRLSGGSQWVKDTRRCGPIYYQGLVGLTAADRLMY